MNVVREEDAAETNLPGRRMRILISPDKSQSKYCQASTIEISPGDAVRPAHAHPNGEEIIYILEGAGSVLIGNKISKVEKGTAVLFPQNTPHMLKNNGSVPMKVICFFAPPTKLDEYALFNEITF